MATAHKDIAEFVRKVRLGAGLTQPQLARILGVSRMVVTNWETARTQPRAADIFQLLNIEKRSKLKKDN